MPVVGWWVGLGPLGVLAADGVLPGCGMRDAPGCCQLQRYGEEPTAKVAVQRIGALERQHFYRGGFFVGSQYQ